ncbi:hypothetical protein ACV1EC_03130 [Aeromonas hydrophila]
MSNFLDKPYVREWVCSASQNYSTHIFGKVGHGVVWSDVRDENDNLLIPLDPVGLVAGINSEPFIMTDGHDPGKPKGQLLKSKLFVDEGGRQFVVAIFGYYAGGDLLLFETLGFDTKASAPIPQRLPELNPDTRVQLAIDPREVDKPWLDQLIAKAEVPIEFLPRSNNAANSALEFITIGLPYVLLVWNPFVTAIASEAGKATYAAFAKWCRSLLVALESRKNPVLEIQAHQDGCQVSFLFRGKNVAKHLAAHESLPKTASGAAQLITNLKKRDMQPQILVYEFNDEGAIWYPSYAILNDKRIISNSAELIAIDKLPAELSLSFIEGSLVSPLADLADSCVKSNNHFPERAD